MGRLCSQTISLPSRLKEAQQSVRLITADKKVETRQVHANGLVRVELCSISIDSLKENLY